MVALETNLTPLSHRIFQRPGYKYLGEKRNLTMIDAIIQDAYSAALISVAIVTLFAVGEFLHRVVAVRVELTRKFTHVGAGVIVLSFPWTISSPWTVLVLSVSFGGLLAIGKVTGLLSSVHNVERRTSGAYYYPVAVLGTFWLSKGDPLLFCVPIAVMALADTAAALVGQRVGQFHYRVFDNSRSVEGSMGFFAFALAVCLAGLALSGTAEWPAMLIVALVAAIMATATEAISVRGSDNLFIPYTCFLVLDRTVRIGLQDLSGWLEGMMLALLILVGSYRIAALTPAGGVTVFVVVTLAWALGGLAWMLPLLALYLLYIFTAPREGAILADLNEVFPTTVGSMIVVLAFGHFGDASLFVPYLATLTASGAIALGRMARMRGWPLIPLGVSGAMTPLIPVIAYEHSVPFTTIALATGAGCAAFAGLRRSDFAGRRMLAALLAGAVAWAAA